MSFSFHSKGLWNTCHWAAQGHDILWFWPVILVELIVISKITFSFVIFLLLFFMLRFSLKKPLLQPSLSQQVAKNIKITANFSRSDFVTCAKATWRYIFTTYIILLKSCAVGASELIGFPSHKHTNVQPMWKLWKSCFKRPFIQMACISIAVITMYHDLQVTVWATTHFSRSSRPTDLLPPE